MIASSERIVFAVDYLIEFIKFFKYYNIRISPNKRIVNNIIC